MHRNQRQQRPLSEIGKWRKANGDGTLRLNYPLTPDSVVFDLGGYVGDWAQQIHNSTCVGQNIKNTTRLG